MYVLFFFCFVFFSVFVYIIKLFTYDLVFRGFWCDKGWVFMRSKLNLGLKYIMTDLINIAIPSTTENSDTVRIQYTGDSVPPGVT